MGQLKCHDAQSETDLLETRSIGFFVDLPPSSDPPKYTESALEIMLQYLSVQIHQKQLEQWLQPIPTEQSSFHIKPATKGTQRILRAVFNRKHKSFILLLRCGKDLVLELRSFVNLLKSDFRRIDNFKAETGYYLESEGDYVAVLGGGSLVFFNVPTLEEKNRISDQDICSAVFFPDEIGYSTVKGHIFRIGRQSTSLHCCLSPLLEKVLGVRLLDAFYLVSVANGLQVADVENSLNYDFFEFKFEKMRIVSHSKERTIVFDKSLQICVVFSPISARTPLHVIKFTSKEYTVDVAAHNDSLYSLTSGGVISRWELFPTGRHIRDLVLNAQLSHCKRLLLTSRQKFAIQTKEAVNFIIFEEETVKKIVF